MDREIDDLDRVARDRMTSNVGKKPCVKCPKGPGQVLCDGCGQYFCVRHLLEHRQELSQQMDALTLEHDELSENFTIDPNDYQQHPLLTRVDRWESNSIERIKTVANDVRSQLRDFLIETKTKLRQSFDDIAHELQESRRLETYTETDLAKWTNQLKQLREQLDKPPMIKMMNDEGSSTHIPFIQLRSIQRVKGKFET